jgi:hypothetical protein
MSEHTLEKAKAELEDHIGRNSWVPESCAAWEKASLAAVGLCTLVQVLHHRDSHCCALACWVDACLCQMLVHSSGLKRNPDMTLKFEGDEHNAQDRSDHKELKAARSDIWARVRVYGLGCKRLGMCFQCSHLGLEKECETQDACVSKDTRMEDAEAEIVHLPDF